MTCPICANTAASDTPQHSGGMFAIDCPQCGTFSISSLTKVQLPDSSTPDHWKISAWMNEFSPGLISKTDIQTALAARIPPLSHRAERMLRWLTTKYPPGQQFSVHKLGQLEIVPQTLGFVDLRPGRLVSSPLIPIGWNQSVEEMKFMLTDVLCKELGYLVSANHGNYQVSPKGLLYLEGRRESISSVGFCAMWFSDEVFPLWREVIEPAITAAGYEALRIDSKEHNGKIDDEIMASIRASKFVVSDFTGSRGGVYYEAGFAHGLGLPVIFMCRENDLKDIHFDVRQYNCILWTPEKLEEAQSQLKNRILATLGQGPKLVQ